MLGLSRKGVFVLGWRVCAAIGLCRYWFVPLTRCGIETLMLYLGFKKQMEHHTDLFQPFCFANVLSELPLL